MQRKVNVIIGILVVGIAVAGYGLRNAVVQSRLQGAPQSGRAITPTRTLTKDLMTIQAQRSFTACIPVNTNISSPYQYEGMNVKMTIGQKLQAIGAYCTTRNILVDKTAKKIDIEAPFGCWGNPPVNYQELLSQETQRIQNLQKTDTVIVPQCNPHIQ